MKLIPSYTNNTDNNVDSGNNNQNETNTGQSNTRTTHLASVAQFVARDADEVQHQANRRSCHVAPCVVEVLD